MCITVFLHNKHLEFKKITFSIFLEQKQRNVLITVKVWKGLESSQFCYITKLKVTQIL